MIFVLKKGFDFAKPWGSLMEAMQSMQHVGNYHIQKPGEGARAVSMTCSNFGLYASCVLGCS